MAVSLIASSDYRTPVILTLSLAAFSLFGSLTVITRQTSKVRWIILVIAIPVAVFTVDNIGRMLMIMNLGGFRILT